MTRRDKQLFYFLFSAIGVVVLLGMFVPVMEVDAAQYASISKQMWQERSFLQIIHRDINYLDKPPLLFWLSGLSMGLFGFTDFAYKLPSVLFSVLGIWSTFRFAKHFYGEQTAYWAALMYASCVAFFVFNNDIRTDTLLINLLIFSVYQLVRYRDTGSWTAFVLTFVGIGLGMLAKGPLGLVFPVLAIGGDTLMRRDWRFFIRWQWLVGLLLVALILLPMCIGLYLQFDSRPYAWVNGEQGVSGLEFYFWTQSFGRITGDSPWATAASNNPGAFFLTTSFLWAFLPWTPLFLVALVIKLRNMVMNKFKAKEGEEWITFFAFILPLLALSKSGYQLNHYIYVVLPFTAIMAGNLLSRWQGVKGAWFFSWRIYAVIFQSAVIGLLVWIIIQVFPSSWGWVFMALIPLSIFMVRGIHGKVSMSLAATSVFCFSVMNGYFYPELLRYQRGKEVSEFYNSIKTPGSRLYFYKVGASHSLDFYQDKWIPSYGYENTDSLLKAEHLYVYTDTNGLKSIEQKKIDYTILDSTYYFPVTQLNWKFLNPETRQEVTRKRYFIELQK